MISPVLDNLLFVFSQVRLQDILDILLVWFIVYRVFMLVRKSGTVQVLSGLGILGLGYILSISLELFTFNWLLEKFFSNLFVIAVVLFQAEIRRALATIGSNPFLTEASAARESQVIEEIAKGILMTAQRGDGGLVVIEREILVDYHIEQGTEIDAKISSELIASIFNPHAPMHDGALLIRGGKIHSAGCFLPLSKNPALDKNLGTRHRAALGLTEETDAVVFVISEENRSIGLVQAGRLQPHLDGSDLRRHLYDIYGFKYKPIQATEMA